MRLLLLAAESVSPLVGRGSSVCSNGPVDDLIIVLVAWDGRRERTLGGVEYLLRRRKLGCRSFL